MNVLVVIDPGHYTGYNPWTMKGHYEGDEMFRLAQLLQEELMARGVAAKLTKQSATENPGLYSRGQIAVKEKRNYDKVVFLSLHDNAPGASAKNPETIRGTMIFASIYRLEGTMDFLTGLQDTVASVIGCGKREIYSRPYTEINPAQDWWGVIRGAMDGAASQEAADQRGVDYAAIIEHDFHTNMDYCMWMAEDANKRKVAAAEAQYIADYFSVRQGSYQIVNGTLNIIYGGLDGVNLHRTPDLSSISVCGRLQYGELRRAVGLVSLPDGTVLYRLEDGEYVTANENYVRYTRNDFESYTARVSGAGTLNVRDFPSSREGGGSVIDVLGEGNLVDVIGETYHKGDHWLMIRIVRPAGNVIGFAAARYMKKA